MKNIMLTRKAFIQSAGAFVALQARGATPALLWKAGIVTDTHVNRTRESCALVKAACDLFAAHDVDIFVNCGDIADHYYPEAYPILKEITDGAFPVKKPQKIWIYANHDHIDRQNEPWRVVMADVKRLLGATNDFFDVMDFKDYPLVSLPQWYTYNAPDYAHVEKMLTDVCKKYPTGPVFVFDHVPPLDTTDNSVTWGDAKRRELYSKFPRVVDICGHAHGSLRSELNIWQGTFTAVNMGCLQVWGGHSVGAAPQSKRNYGAVVMEVYPDRLVFRRFDVRTKAEYSAAEPWTVPLPFDPATAPYRRERTTATEPVPAFPAGATLALAPDAPFSALTLAFPRAEGAHGTYIYKVEVTSAEGTSLARCDLFGQFYLPEDAREPRLERRLSAGYFEPGRSYRVRVTPCNCFGKGGRPIEATFAAPSARPGTTLFASTDPMSDCGFWTGLSGGKQVKATDGWYAIGGGNYRLVFPDGVWGKEKGKFRFTVDLEMEQDGPRTWTLVLRHPEPLTNANARIATPIGASGLSRYVIEFARRYPAHNYYLLVREGGPGRIRFKSVRIERV